MSIRRGASVAKDLVRVARPEGRNAVDRHRRLQHVPPSRRDLVGIVLQFERDRQRTQVPIRLLRDRIERGTRVGDVHQADGQHRSARQLALSPRRDRADSVASRDGSERAIRPLQLHCRSSSRSPVALVLDEQTNIAAATGPQFQFAIERIQPIVHRIRSGSRSPSRSRRAAPGPARRAGDCRVTRVITAP